MFYDLNNNPLVSSQIDLAPGEQTLFYLRVDCVTGKHLRVEFQDMAQSLIEAQITGVDWTDLSGAGIALDTWNGTRQTFAVRITADDVDGFALDSVIWKTA